MSIKVDNLFYTYSKKTPFESEALHDISLEIKEGSFTALIGQTGSGKSTLVQHLNGLIWPQEGKIEVDEFILDSKKKKHKKIKDLRKHVGVVFQFPEYQLFEDTVEKDVAFGPKNFGFKDKEALDLAHQALLSVGIKEEYFTRSPFELSGGERRRVAIAGILALNPDILVLDEPTAGLDPVGCLQIMSLVQKMHRDGKTIIIVTHDMDLVMKYASDVIILKDGGVAFKGTPKELFKESREELSIEIPQLYQFIALLKEKGIEIDADKVHDINDLVDILRGIIK